MVASTAELMNKGMKFDYTKWQREYFDAKTPEEISREAAEYAKANPYAGNAVRV